MYSKRIAVDLAKNVFQLAECDLSGKVVSRKRLNRTEMRFDGNFIPTSTIQTAG